MSKFEDKTSKFRSLRVSLAISFLAFSAFALLITSSLELYFNFLTQQNLVATQQKSIAQDAANSVRDFIEQKLILEKMMGL